MKVERKTIKKVPYLVTDEIYNDDNIGISLKTLNETNTTRTMDIDCFPISFTETNFFNKDNKIKVKTKLNNIDTDIVVLTTITYPNRISEEFHKIDDITFATDLIQTCIHNQKDIKKIPCYDNVFNEIIESIKDNALSEDTLIRTPELYNKIYVYDANTDIYMGTACRLLQNNGSMFTLGEYIGKKANELNGSEIYFDICINNELTLRLTNIRVVDSNDTSVDYWGLNMTNARVKRIKNTYPTIKYNMKSRINLPEYMPGWSYASYYDNLNNLNSENVITQFYKDNKPDFNNKININKYLIGF